MSHQDDRPELVDQSHKGVAVERLGDLRLLHERHLRSEELVERRIARAEIVDRIAGLQLAQYKNEFRTNDHVAIDYKKLASSVAGVLAVSGGADAGSLRAALKTAYAHNGLSVIHVAVYCGPDELGGLGAWGEWNVGNWCDDVQASWIKQDL